MQLSCNLNRSEITDLRWASMRGKFPFEFTWLDNGDTTFTAPKHKLNELCVKLERVVRFNETSAKDVFNLFH